MTRRRFIRNAAGLLVLTTALGSVPLPLGFWKSSASGGISAAAQTALTDWVTRVQGLNPPSDVTIAGTQTAVGIFIDGLMTDGVWSKIVRMNIYAGNEIWACRAPLKNGGPSAVDAMDTMVSSGTYSQSTGLTGGTALPARCVDTGIPGNTTTGGIGDNNVHWSIYTRTSPDAGITDDLVDGTVEHYLLISYLNLLGTNVYWRSGGSDTIGGGPSGSVGIGHFIGSQVSSSSNALYQNGTLIASSTNAGGTRASVKIAFHCQNYNGTLQVPTGQTVEMYSIGVGLTATDAANFTSRYTTLRTALGR